MVEYLKHTEFFITVPTSFVMLGRKKPKTFKTDLKLLFGAESIPLFKQQKDLIKKEYFFSRLSIMQCIFNFEGRRQKKQDYLLYLKY